MSSTTFEISSCHTAYPMEEDLLIAPSPLNHRGASSSETSMSMVGLIQSLRDLFRLCDRSFQSSQYNTNDEKQLYEAFEAVFDKDVHAISFTKPAITGNHDEAMDPAQEDEELDFNGLYDQIFAAYLKNGIQVKDVFINDIGHCHGNKGIFDYYVQVDPILGHRATIHVCAQTTCGDGGKIVRIEEKETTFPAIESLKHMISLYENDDTGRPATEFDHVQCYRAFLNTFHPTATAELHTTLARAIEQVNEDPDNDSAFQEEEERRAVLVKRLDLDQIFEHHKSLWWKTNDQDEQGPCYHSVTKLVSIRAIAGGLIRYSIKQSLVGGGTITTWSQAWTEHGKIVRVVDRTGHNLE